MSEGDLRAWARERATCGAPVCGIGNGCSGGHGSNSSGSGSGASDSGSSSSSGSDGSRSSSSGSSSRGSGSGNSSNSSRSSGSSSSDSSSSSSSSSSDGERESVGGEDLDDVDDCGGGATARSAPAAACGVACLCVWNGTDSDGVRAVARNWAAKAAFASWRLRATRRDFEAGLAARLASCHAPDGPGGLCDGSAASMDVVPQAPVCAAGGAVASVAAGPCSAAVAAAASAAAGVAAEAAAALSVAVLGRGRRCRRGVLGCR
eukprot:scaffold76827_cov58-Phaeocystis_antarctica.AAC.1